MENGEIAGNKHFLLLTQSFPNSQGKNSIIMKFYCLANSYHTQTSRYNNFSFISANIYSIFFGNRVLELIASPVLHINYITYIKIVSGSMFYSGNRLVQYSCRVTTLLTYCPIYWNNLVYFTSQGRRVRPETAQISIYKFTLNDEILDLSNLTLYLICQFWALPIQQQIKILCQKYGQMGIQLISINRKHCGKR